MMEDLVSIVTPNFNGEKYIAASIISVIDQTYKNWELIIIDDCSTDKSISIVKEFLSDKRIKLIKLNSNCGTIVARNTGIEHASGRYISFLDSDDKWMPEKLQVQLKYMTDADAPFSFTSYKMIDSDEKLINTFNVPPEVSYKKLLATCEVGCSTVMYDTSVIGKQFFNNASPKAREDYVQWLSISKNFPEIRMSGISEPLTIYRKHDMGISANKSIAAINNWRVYRNIEKLNFVTSLFYIIQYAFYGFKKHYFRNK